MKARIHETVMEITFSNNFVLSFDIHETFIARRWVNAIKEVQAFSYPVDNTKLFYGFNDQAEEQRIALERINKSIETINKHSHLIDRTVEDVTDQDTLNYLHNIFEVYHGLLTREVHPYYADAPEAVRQALADLNANVHHCESAYRSYGPYMTLTWYNLLKDRIYCYDDLTEITNRYQFGTVYLNYAEIGKTLEDLYIDNDIYLDAKSFRPLHNFGADFTVKFFDADSKKADQHKLDVINYAKEHKSFINKAGFDERDICLRPGLIPVADLDTELPREEVLANIRESQHVIDIKLR